jgi:4-amino-4-deoxy-L-arabinose transferase-like glycosyltransferase
MNPPSARFGWNRAPAVDSFNKPARPQVKLARPKVRAQSYLLVYTCIAAFLLLIHEPLLPLPYYWDELGQFIPASLDLFDTGSWIPHSTLPNVHPPAVMAYLATFWHFFGYSIAGTRVAMLLVAAAGALVSFLLAIELSRGVPQAPAFSALALLCVSPLFFAQSMLAQLDMPAMCLTLLALLLFLQNRWRDSALACVALVLVKETGIVAPALLGGWLLAERRVRQALWYLLPLVALAGWLFILKRGTGHWFGNRGFTQYNLYYPLNPIRFGLALLRRFYFLFIGSGHFIGTLLFAWAYRRMPLFRDRHWRITGAFLALHTVVVSALGGAVLERYLLPVLPIVYIAFAISLTPLPPQPGRWTLAALLSCLIAAAFINPPYPFPFENNLAFVSFVNLQEKAAAAVQTRPGTLATAFPMADAFRRPEFGFVWQSRRIQEIESFRAGDIARLAADPPDLMIVYDTVWDPLHLVRNFMSSWMRRYYDYEPAMPPDAIAQKLSMRVARRWELHGLSMSLLERIHE